MEEANILAQEKPKTIKLADGKDYTLPPIDMTTLANAQNTMGFKLHQFASKMDDDVIETIRLLAYALFKETYPDITLDQIGHLVGIKEIKLLGRLSVQ